MGSKYALILVNVFDKFYNGDTLRFVRFTFHSYNRYRTKTHVIRRILHGRFLLKFFVRISLFERCERVSLFRIFALDQSSY